MNKQQEQLARATEIANRHADLHPWEVAFKAIQGQDPPDFDSFLVGLMHDSIEDEEATPEELAIFSDVVYEAVSEISRRDGEPYWDYIARIKQSSALVRHVKLSDARVNLARCVGSFGHTSKEKRYRRVIEELS